MRARDGRTAAASPGRPRGGRRRPPGRSATARPSRSQQHVAAPQVAVQARRRLRRAGELARSGRRRARPRRCRAARGPLAGRSGSSRPLGVERRPVAARRRWAARAAPDPQRAGPRASRPNVVARPPRASPPGPRRTRPRRRGAPSSTQSSTSTVVADTPSTSGTRSAPGSASQRRPAASAAYSPGAASGAGLHERRRTRPRTGPCRPR